ncbi:MAG: protein phosphatase 2C domain-containing protein [Polyangiaceae bacterium]
MRGGDPNKQVNEDAFRIVTTNEGLLAVVCDGMGGHLGGQLASQAAIHAIENTWLASGVGSDPRRRLGECIERAASEVYALGGTTATAERPGSTCVALWLSGRELYVGHVGDSRAYRLRERQLYRLTTDHTVVEAWILAGQLSREQAKGHPDAHRITRALGIAPTVEVELRPSEDVRIGDRLLLCSDGLTDLVEDVELADWLGRAESLDAIAESLINLANSRGGHDNITVLLVEVLGLAPAATEGFGTTLCGAASPARTVATTALGDGSLERATNVPYRAASTVLVTPKDAHGAPPTIVTATKDGAIAAPTLLGPADPKPNAEELGAPARGGIGNPLGGAHPNPLPATGVAKTVAIDPVSESQIRGTDHVQIGQASATAPLAGRAHKTLPFTQRGLENARAPQGPLPSLPPERTPRLPSQKRLWWALVVALLLSLLAILVRVLRHRSG